MFEYEWNLLTMSPNWGWCRNRSWSRLTQSQVIRPRSPPLIYSSQARCPFSKKSMNIFSRVCIYRNFVASDTLSHHTRNLYDSRWLRALLLPSKSSYPWVLARICKDLMSTRERISCLTHYTIHTLIYFFRSCFDKTKNECVRLL